MQLKVHPIKLSLERPFTIAHGTFYSREALIIELIDGAFSGFGEATVITYYNKNLKNFLTLLQNNKAFVEGLSVENPKTFWKEIYPIFKKDTFVLCALDVAAHDLWAKKRQLPLYKAWGLNIENTPISNFTIAIDTIEDMVAQMKANPYPIYKIKLGTKEDIQIIKALRQHSDAVFRVDANGAWSVEETLKNGMAFKELGVEFIEQPLASENWEGMKILYQKSALPIIADESCQIEADVEKCYQHFHGINIKLMKCGGYIPALRMIEKAKSLNMKTMVGCMTESSVGISAIAHLAPLLDYIDMDGALLLKKDPATGVKIDTNGKAIFPSKNGHGGELNF